MMLLGWHFSSDTLSIIVLYWLLNACSISLYSSAVGGNGIQTSSLLQSMWTGAQILTHSLRPKARPEDT